MKFPYRMALVVSPETGDPEVILRPEIWIRLRGPQGNLRYKALLDTGADRTIIPESIAMRLGIVLRDADGAPATGFGGQKLQTRHAEVELVLEADGESYQWTITGDFVAVASDAAETILLGYAGFLEYFRATFDPEFGVIDLDPNSLHPGIL